VTCKRCPETLFWVTKRSLTGNGFTSGSGILSEFAADSILNRRIGVSDAVLAIFLRNRLLQWQDSSAGFFWCGSRNALMSLLFAGHLWPLEDWHILRLTPVLFFNES